jgi:DNA replication and repair protein RecF
VAANAILSQSAVAARASVYVRELSLTDFRSYHRLRLALDGRSVVLTGDNGVGKTNLLEAISFLAPGQGLRRARLGAVTRIDADAGWAVAAAVDLPQSPGVATRLGTGLVAAEDGSLSDRRIVRIDGQQQTGTGRLAELLSVSWLTPEMDRLFLEGASGRRRFLDRLVLGFDAGHGRRVNAYEKAMRDRSRLLRDRGRSADPGWLDALEAAMAEHGVAVAAARCEMLSRLAAILEQRGDVFPVPLLALEGELEQWLADQRPAVEVEDAFCALLAASRQRDMEAGRALAGPHRTDMLAWHKPTGMPAADCSTGQQKAMLISIVLANARLLRTAGTPPLLLLDEVVAHLDAVRRAALFDEIEALGAQAWLTGTDRQLFAGLGCRAQHFEVADGIISEVAAP